MNTTTAFGLDVERCALSQRDEFHVFDLHTNLFNVGKYLKKEEEEEAMRCDKMKVMKNMHTSSKLSGAEASSWKHFAATRTPL